MSGCALVAWYMIDVGENVAIRGFAEQGSVWWSRLGVKAREK